MRGLQVGASRRVPVVVRRRRRISRRISEGAPEGILSATDVNTSPHEPRADREFWRVVDGGWSLGHGHATQSFSEHGSRFVRLPASNRGAGY
jgi:hypothetical protein